MEDENIENQRERYKEILKARAPFYEAIERGGFISPEKMQHRITF